MKIRIKCKDVIEQLKNHSAWLNYIDLDGEPIEEIDPEWKKKLDKYIKNNSLRYKYSNDCVLLHNSTIEYIKDSVSSILKELHDELADSDNIKYEVSEYDTFKAIFKKYGVSDE